MSTDIRTDGYVLEVDGMTVLRELPPVWDSVVHAFGVIPATAVFTYAAKIYNPSGGYIPDHVIEHEKVHTRQQALLGPGDQGAALWWGRFLRDTAFRIDQESEAYGVQYAYVCSRQSDRNARNRFLWQIAQTLSGPIYGKCISFSEAMALIKRRSGVK